MSENFKVQQSYKLGPNGVDMLNVRGDSVDEFVETLDKLRDHLGLITEVGNLARGITVVTETLGPVSDVDSQPAQPQPQVQQQVVAPAPAPQQQVPQLHTAPTCDHGARQFRSGAKNGKSWSAWFCPQPKGQPQCDPVWNK